MKSVPYMGHPMRYDTINLKDEEKPSDMNRKMKNLFSYATKELAQDAFLRWLFENYRCEDASVRAACRRLFESFTENRLDFDKITDLKTEAQWKKIDVSIWFKIDGVDYLIVIEDKVESAEHDQLDKYTKSITEHNDWWKEHQTRYEKTRKEQDIRFINDEKNIFKIFYKTDLVDDEERKRVKDYGWCLYDLNEIARLFADLSATDEILRDYCDHIHEKATAIRRETPPSKWGLLEWHAFFRDYEPSELISAKKEIGRYQNSFYYIKFFVKGHETDYPCLEIRSRDFVFDENTGRNCQTALAVLYSIDRAKIGITRETIDAWQQKLIQNEFHPSNRKDVETHQQIAKITRECAEDTEESLKQTLYQLETLLAKTFL